MPLNAVLFLIGNRRLHYFYLLFGVCFNVLYIILSLKVDWTISCPPQASHKGLSAIISVDYCVFSRTPLALMLRYLSYAMAIHYLLSLHLQTVLIVRESSRFALNHGRNLSDGIPISLRLDKAWKIYKRFILSGTYEIASIKPTSSTLKDCEAAIEDDKSRLLDHDEFISDSDEEFDSSSSRRHDHTHSHHHGHHDDESQTAQDVNRSPSSMSISAMDRA